jgi:hypothetical protein
MLMSRFPAGDYSHVPPADAARARLIVVPYISPGIAGLTLGRFVFVRRERVNDTTLLRHELVHVQQWRELGMARFLFRYLRSYVTARRAGHSHWDAYEAIPFEIEARSRARAGATVLR